MVKAAYASGAGIPGGERHFRRAYLPNPPAPSQPSGRPPVAQPNTRHGALLAAGGVTVGGRPLLVAGVPHGTLIRHAVTAGRLRLLRARRTMRAA